MAYQKKAWLNEGDDGANDTNSVLNKINMNDLETRIENAFNEPPTGENCVPISHQDLNTICGNKTGFYVGTDLTNAPGGSKSHWFKVIHISMNDKYKTQIAFNSSTGTGWHRSCVNGDWLDWLLINEASRASYVSMANNLTADATNHTSQPLKIAKIGRLIYLEGRVVISYPNAGELLKIANIPDEFLPTMWNCFVTEVAATPYSYGTIILNLDDKAIYFRSSTAFTNKKTISLYHSYISKT